MVKLGSFFSNLEDSKKQIISYGIFSKSVLTLKSLTCLSEKYGFGILESYELLPDPGVNKLLNPLEWPTPNISSYGQNDKSEMMVCDGNLW